MTIISTACSSRSSSRGEGDQGRAPGARARGDGSRSACRQEIGERYPHQLSGGQKQRVNIARALTLRPKLIVCDEVVAALDMSIRGDVLNLFADLQRDLGLTYVFITHDLSVVSHISDRIAVMYLGRFVELGPAESVVRAAAASLYAGAVVGGADAAAVDRCAATVASSCEGEIPSPIDPPSGCRFRTRCQYAQPLCAEQTPAWREARAGSLGRLPFRRSPEFFADRQSTDASAHNRSGGHMPMTRANDAGRRDARRWRCYRRRRGRRRARRPACAQGTPKTRRRPEGLGAGQPVEPRSGHRRRRLGPRILCSPCTTR